LKAPQGLAIAVQLLTYVIGCNRNLTLLVLCDD
jgi:hypothetical protein